MINGQPVITWYCHCTEILLCRSILFPRLITGTIQSIWQQVRIIFHITHLKWQNPPDMLLWQPMWTAFMLSVHQFQHLHTKLLTPRYTNSFHVYQKYLLYMNKVKKLIPNGRSIHHLLWWLKLSIHWKKISFMLVTAEHTLILVYTCIKSLFGICITTRTP